MQAGSPAESSVCTSKSDEGQLGVEMLHMCGAIRGGGGGGGIFGLGTDPFWSQIFILSPQNTSDTDTNAGAHYCQYVD